MTYFDRLQTMANRYCDTVCTTKEMVAIAVEEFMLNMYGFNTKRFWAVSPLIKPSYKIAVTGEGMTFAVVLTGVKVNFKNATYQGRLPVDLVSELSRKFSGNDFKITLK